MPYSGRGAEEVVSVPDPPLLPHSPWMERQLIQQTTTARKVLLVDDDRLVLATLSKGLEQAGYDVQACASAEEAKRIINLERPDIAVLDVPMPGESGLDLAVSA